jgi:hypothetical protein
VANINPKPMPFALKLLLWIRLDEKRDPFNSSCRIGLVAFFPRSRGTSFNRQKPSVFGVLSAPPDDTATEAVTGVTLRLRFPRLSGFMA